MFYMLYKQTIADFSYAFSSFLRSRRKHSHLKKVFCFCCCCCYQNCCCRNIKVFVFFMFIIDQINGDKNKPDSSKESDIFSILLSIQSKKPSGPSLTVIKLFIFIFFYFFNRCITQQADLYDASWIQTLGR